MQQRTVKRRVVKATTATPPCALVMIALTALCLCASCGPSFRDAYPLTPSASAYEWYLHARILEEEGRYEEALEMIKRARASEPRSLDIRVEYADLLRLSGQLDPALKMVVGVLERRPEHAGASIVMARCEWERAKPEAALRALAPVLERDPQDGAALALRSEILLDLGREDDARVTLSALVEAHPSRAWGWRKLGQLALERGSHARAIETLERALALSMNDELPFLELAEAYRAVDREDDARVTLERCVDAGLPAPRCGEALRRTASVSDGSR